MKTLLYTLSLLILSASAAFAQHHGGGGASHVGGFAPHSGGVNHGVAPVHQNYSRPYQYQPQRNYGNFNRSGYGYRPYVNNNYYGAYGYGLGLGYFPNYGNSYGYGGFGYGSGNLRFGLNCPYPYGTQAYSNCFFRFYGYYPY